MAKKKAIILGISGQDGGYLSRCLLEKGYEVHGTSRDHEVNLFDNLKKLGILEKLELYSVPIRLTPIPTTCRMLPLSRI